MSDEYTDPSGNTQAFRAFVNQPEPEAARSRTPLIIGAVAVVAVVALLVALLVFG
jgi:hypothetical protein